MKEEVRQIPLKDKLRPKNDFMSIVSLARRRGIYVITDETNCLLEAPKLDDFSF